MQDFADTKPAGLYEAAIGEKNQDYYVEKFEVFDQQGPGLKVSWNWPAFIFNVTWALYRKMYGVFFAWLALSVVLGVLERPLSHASPNAQLIVGGVSLAIWLLFGAFANSLYHIQIKARIDAVTKSTSDAAKKEKRLKARGGVNSWVPLVCGAVPVIGILAAVALPAYQDYTKRSNPFGKFDSSTAKLVTESIKPEENPFGKPAPEPDWDKGTITPPTQEGSPANIAYGKNDIHVSDVAPTQTAETQEHYRQIYAAHPDADAVLDSAAFKTWVAKYPTYQRFLVQGTTQEIVGMFTAYKNQR